MLIRRGLPSFLLIGLTALTGCTGSDDTPDAAVSPDLLGPTTADLSLLPTIEHDLSVTAPAQDQGQPDLEPPFQGPPALAVDDHFSAEGYMGDGSQGGIKDDPVCAATRPGQALGKCHQFTWTPGSQGWGGVWWQSPGGNWGGPNDPQGYAMLAGYSQVRFYAWGKSGGETVSFMTGYGRDGIDSYQQKIDIRLTATPTLYVLGIRGAYATHLAGGFGWVAGGAKQTVVFSVDDIEIAAPPPGANTPAALGVDKLFGPSGYMGDGSLGYIHDDPASCTAPTGGGAGCHHFIWDPSNPDGGLPQGWGGVWFQSNVDNWGRPTDPAGAVIPSGYSELRFWAWGAVGGEAITFLSGISLDSKDAYASKLDIKLTTTPTQYSIGVGGSYGANVAGGFGWVAGGTGASFFIDNAEWR